MTVAELVDRALVPVRYYFSTTPPIEVEDWEDNPKTRYTGENLDVDNAIRLRLDWELTGPGRALASNNDHIARLLCEQLRGDLIDIVENGDKSSNDPVLKSMDGANKLGKSPSDIRIEELIYYREERPKKESFEYTVFLLLHVDWEE